VALEAGNTLFRVGEGAGVAEKARAGFILETLAAQGVRAFAVGHRDLAAGASWLADRAGRSKVVLLSANLFEGAQRRFASGTVLNVAKLKIGVVGLTQVGPVPGQPALRAEALGPALKSALASLGPRDVTVVLAAVPYAEVLALDAELRGVDFVVQSSDGRGTVPVQTLDSGARLLGAGQRGQALNVMKVQIRGPGPFVDGSDAGRQQAQVTYLDAQLATLQDRLGKATDVEAKRQLKETMAQMKLRREEQASLAKKAAQAAPRVFEQRWLVLDASVVDAPKVKAQVLVHEPTYAGQH
jgi:2',3'-cyclic-nucleotide 2'-phosphodiesterase (5'-nucleotidase family)